MSTKTGSSRAGTGVIIAVVGLAIGIGSCVHGTSKNLDSACAATKIPITLTPAVQDVALGERSYTLYFREVVSSSGRSTNISPPESLSVEVEGEPRPQVNRSLDATPTSIGEVNIRGIGSLDVPRAGRYKVRVISSEPRGSVCIGYQEISDATLVVRAAGIFFVGALIGAVVGRGRKKTESEPAPS